jgi:DNA-directed DNA polymerase III PolC
LEEQKFVALHNHTAKGSLLDSMVRVEELTKKAKELGMKSVAISDHGTLHSMVDFYKSALNEGIKPIFAVEMYMVEDIKVKDKNEKKRHLLLIAKNEKGFKNLFKLITIGNEHFYKKPQIDFETLLKYKEGLIVGSACIGGKIPQLALKKDFQNMMNEIIKYKKAFGEDFYLEIMANKLKEQLYVNKVLVKASEKTGVKLIATNDIHYLNKEDFETHDIMLAIQTKAKLTDENRFRFEANEFYLKDYEEMKADLFNGDKSYDKYAEKALKNTIEVADKVEEFELKLGETNFPDYLDLPDKYTPDEYLTGIANHRLKGLAKNKNINYKEYKERLDYELDIITAKGFSTYFLVIADIVGWGKKNDLLFGYGRGSAGSSLVSYLLGIIEIDPIEYDLVFSRFLNKERDSLPDIDIDISNQAREEVIEYIKNKYGKDYVAQICTFGTMSTKAVLKDVGRTLGIDFMELNKGIVPCIKDEAGSLSEALEMSSKLRGYQKKYPKLFEHALKLEGLPRHLSKHAGAVVVSPKKITDIVPMSNTKGDMVTQTEMHDSEELGLLKIDLLGLKTLDLVKRTIDFIGERKDYDKLDKKISTKGLKNLRLDDPKVYKYIYEEGDTSGVFQVESKLFRGLLEKMKPDDFEHIIAILALGRPSILQADLDKTFIKRMHGEEEVEYPHEDLKPILENTFGIMLYQEQVLKVAQKIAGFSLGRADILRRAMGKKKPEVMEKMKKEFIEGSLENGYTKEKAEEIFELIEYFAGYGFNRCLSGDTLLEKSNNEKLSVKNLYDTWHEKQKINLLSLSSDGRIRPRKVKNVFKTGKKKLYKITLENGQTIKSSKDHKFMTSNKEWKRLYQLSAGEELLVKGDYEEESYPIIPTKIISIEYIGEEMTYDIEMYSDSENGHNYIANDIITHNSHSAAYAKLSYTTAYLKYYFPTEFYASLLTMESDKTPKDSNISKYMSECFQKEINIKPPHINKSIEDFNVVDGEIRFGLRNISGVGQKALEDILEKRPFVDFLDFFERVDHRLVNKTVVEALIKSGSFDFINENRNELLFKYQELRKNNKVRQYLLPQFNYADQKEIQVYEKETLSYSITFPSKWEKAQIGEHIYYEGTIEDVYIHKTKNNNEMAFFTLDFKSGKVKVISFPQNYYKNIEQIKNGNFIKLVGEKLDNESLSLKGVDEANGE